MNLLRDEVHDRMLGKKRELDAARPLPPEVVGKLRGQMAVEYTFNSNAIEGNTLTLRETQMVIEEGFTAGGKSLREVLEARNHPAAIAYVEELSKRSVEEADVLKVHAILFDGADEAAGAYRTGQVRIAGADFMPPLPQEIKPRMIELMQWLRTNPDELRPVELAAVFHHRLVCIHPFFEGNGRVARLLMNCVLLKYGYPFVIVLRNDRRTYYRTLREADHGSPSPFVGFVARCVERSLNLYLAAVGERTVVSLQEASRSTGLSQEYLSLLARRGAIDAFKIGKEWVTTQKALEKYLKRNSSS
jgi:Fic family protein